jgi:hypothetical protein
MRRSYDRRTAGGRAPAVNSARAQLDTLAEALLTDETVREDAPVRMLGARPGLLSCASVVTTGYDSSFSRLLDAIAGRFDLGGDAAPG